MSVAPSRLLKLSVSFSLLRDFLGSVGIQATSRFLAMILSIILARALGPHGFGIYAYAFAIMNLLMILAEAGVPTLLLREIAAGRSRGAWGVVRGLMQRSLQVVALVSIGISLLGFLFLIISVQTITTETYHTFEAMLFLLPMVALSKTVAHALRGFDKVLSSQVLELILWPGLALLVAASFFVVDEAYRTPWAAMWAQAIAVGTTLFFAIALLLRSVPKEVVACAPEYEMRRWSRAFPHFMMLAAALVINNQVDIIMLSWVVDSKASGIYRVASQSAVLLLFGLQAMTAVVAPKIAQHYARGEIASLQKLIRRASQVITITMLPVFFIFCFAGAQLVPLVFGEQYTNSYAPMMILAASQLMVAALGLSGPLLSMCGHEKKISKTIWASTVINIVLNALLIPIWHENGAAVATAITSMCWTSYLAWFALKQMNILVSPIGIRHEVKVNSGGSHGAR